MHAKWQYKRKKRFTYSAEIYEEKMKKKTNMALDLKSLTETKFLTLNVIFKT